MAREWGRREADFSLYTFLCFFKLEPCAYIVLIFLNVPEKTQVWSLLQNSLCSHFISECGFLCKHLYPFTVDCVFKVTRSKFASMLSRSVLGFLTQQYLE